MLFREFIDYLNYYNLKPRIIGSDPSILLTLDYKKDTWLYDGCCGVFIFLNLNGNQRTCYVLLEHNSDLVLGDLIVTHIKVNKKEDMGKYGNFQFEIACLETDDEWNLVTKNFQDWGIVHDMRIKAVQK